MPTAPIVNSTGGKGRGKKDKSRKSSDFVYETDDLALGIAPSTKQKRANGGTEKRARKKRKDKDDDDD